MKNGLSIDFDVGKRFWGFERSLIEYLEVDLEIWELDMQFLN